MRSDITTTGSPEGPGPQNQTRRPRGAGQRDKLSDRLRDTADSGIQQIWSTLFHPRRLVRSGQRLQIRGRRRRVIDPFAQSRPAVDDVDGQPVEDVFVREVAPQGVVRIQPPDRLEPQRLQPPGPERRMVIGRVIDCLLYTSPSPRDS